MSNLIPESLLEDNNIYQGLPPLESTEKANFFEYWPTKLIYLPILLYSFWLGIKYRNWKLPLITNPGLPLSGMAGEQKSIIYSCFTGEAKKHLPKWCQLQVIDSLNESYNLLQQKMIAEQLYFPLVGKPDIGCRGMKVQVLHSKEETLKYLSNYTSGAIIIFQELIHYTPEAGIFYIRHPNQKKGEIFSLCLKYPAYIIGDGQHTLKYLIQKQARHKKLIKLFLNKHQQYENCIIPLNKRYRLNFAGSHTLGAIFKDGKNHVTQSLIDKIDQVCQSVPEFYIGRLDVKFKNIEDLKQGKNFKIIELNGASSEAIHIWDSNHSLQEVYKTFFKQYNELYKIGSLNRDRGFKLPSLKELRKSLGKEFNSRL